MTETCPDMEITFASAPVCAAAKFAHAAVKTANRTTSLQKSVEFERIFTSIRYELSISAAKSFCITDAQDITCQPASVPAKPAVAMVFSAAKREDTVA